MAKHEVCFPKFPVKQIASRIIAIRKITRIDQHLFMSALLSKQFLSREEEMLVERIYEDLNQGLIKVVE